MKVKDLMAKLASLPPDAEVIKVADQGEAYNFYTTTAWIEYYKARKDSSLGYMSDLDLEYLPSAAANDADYILIS